MNKYQLSEADRLKEAFESIERETPSLKPIANAFKEVFISRAILKASLSERSALRVSAPEQSGLSEGQPWLTKETIASLIDPWGETTESTIPPLAKAFPDIKADLFRLWETLKKGDVDLEYCLVALVKESEDDINEIASRLGFKPIILKFILSQMLKPFVERRTESLQPLIRNLSWYKGYCPICGFLPELSFLQGDQGQRWLRCALLWVRVEIR